MDSSTFSEDGIQLLRRDTPLAAIASHGTTATLLSSASSGVEVIEFSLDPSINWYIMADPGWEGTEFVRILAGKIHCTVGSQSTVIQAGDTISVDGATSSVVFTALTHAQFIYVSSQPVFHMYSDFFTQLIHLAESIEQLDGATSDHCYRIGTIAQMMAAEMRLSPSEVNSLNYGSVLHDVGKSKVPYQILNKPGPLTAAEYEIVKLHSLHGRDMLQETGLPRLMAAGVIVAQHHERYNGSGYPHGLKGDDIEVGAAIVAVVDSYDAMLSERVYKKPKPKAEAIQEIITNRGVLFHPVVVDSFIKILDDINALYQPERGGKA